jgi:hypothetical protein
MLDPESNTATSLNSDITPENLPAYGLRALKNTLYGLLWRGDDRKASARLCQPSTLRIVIWPEASRVQNNMAAISAEDSTVCVLIRRLNSSCSLDRIRRADRFPLAFRETREGEKLVAGLFQAIGDGLAL